MHKHNYVTRFDVIFFCFRTLTSYLNKKERWLTHSFSMPIFFSIFLIKWTKKNGPKNCQMAKMKADQYIGPAGRQHVKNSCFPKSIFDTCIDLVKTSIWSQFRQMSQIWFKFHSKFHWWTIFLFLESLLTFQDRDLKVVCLQGQKRVEKKHSAPITGL